MKLKEQIERLFKFEAHKNVKLLLISDLHIDSKKCDLALLKKHLDKAKKDGAYIMMFGDIFDLMQGRYDPRRNKQDLNPAFKSATYLDDVVKFGVDFFEPYVDNIAFIGYGNHETGIVKNCETDPLARMVYNLEGRTGVKLNLGHYEGWINLSLNDGGSLIKYVIQYHHGYGGNAPRSKGVLNVDIDSMKYPDANLIVRGHDHNKWHQFVVRERLNMSKHVIEEEVQDHLRLGSYKKKPEGFGWEVQKGFGHTPKGGWWVELKVHRYETKRSIKTKIYAAD